MGTEDQRAPQADDRSSYCWIRILRVTDDATVPAEKRWVVPNGLMASHGGRPPGSVASEPDTLLHARQPGQATTWQGDPDYFGRADADTVFDYGPVFNSREAAIEWLTTKPSGQQWDREALNRMLIRVQWGQTVTPAIEACKPLAEHEKLTTDTDEPAGERFPDDQWSELACTRHAPTNLSGLFDPSKVHCPDIKDVKSAGIDECRQVADAVAQHGATHDGLIRRQAHGLGQALLPVLSVIGVDPDQPQFKAWTMLIAQVAEPAEAAIFLEKRRHGRRRPWQACGSSVTPLFSIAHALPDGRTQPHLLYPGHPSYPSGHATMAYLWAGLIAAIKPQLKTGLMGAAEAVSLNRVYAGLHYPSDIEGGKQLAEAMVKQIQLKSSFMKDLAGLVP